MSSNCLNCKKIAESKNSNVVKTKKKEECFYHNVQRVTVKKQDLSKKKVLLSSLVIRKLLKISFYQNEIKSCLKIQENRRFTMCLSKQTT